MYLHFEKIPQNDGRKPTICFNKTPDSVPRQVCKRRDSLPRSAVLALWTPSHTESVSPDITLE